jgi:predicted amidohydrolase YtcJ
MTIPLLSITVAILYFGWRWHARSATNRSDGGSADLPGRRVIPGLNDSPLHVIRGGLNFNLQLHAVVTA